MSLHYTRSQARISRNPQRSEISPIKRTCYINDDLSTSKDIATTFHSPYKNGKKNRQFCNPTFASSDIFQGGQQANTCLTPRHNLVYNRNQRQRDQLYRKRMQKQDYVTNLIHRTVAEDLSQRRTTRKANDQTLHKQVLGRSISRSSYKCPREEQLTNELQTLQKYRQKQESLQKRLSARLNTTGGFSRDKLSKQPEGYNQTMRLSHNSGFQQRNGPMTPSENRNTCQRNRIPLQSRNNLNDWMVVSDKIKKLKQETKESRREPVMKTADHFVMDQLNRNHLKEVQSRKNAALLANVLREQIKQSELKRVQDKKDKQSLN